MLHKAKSQSLSRCGVTEIRNPSYDYQQLTVVLVLFIRVCLIHSSCYLSRTDNLRMAEALGFIFGIASTLSLWRVVSRWLDSKKPPKENDLELTLLTDPDDPRVE